MGPLPEDLEELPAGAQLATLLASVNRATLNDKDRLRLAPARNRQVSHEQAELMADLYAVTIDEPPEQGSVHPRQASRDPWAETELAFALRWTSTATGHRLEQARQLIEDLPAVHAALTAGLLEQGAADLRRGGRVRQRGGDPVASDEPLVAALPFSHRAAIAERQHARSSGTHPRWSGGRGSHPPGSHRFRREPLDHRAPVIRLWPV